MIVKVKDIKVNQVKKLLINFSKDRFSDIDPEAFLTSSVTGEIRLFLEDKICLQGKISYSLKIPCFKCNEFFENPFKVDINEYYEETNPFSSSVKEIELDGKSILTFPVIDGEINIFDIVRDYIITSIPMHTLCPICDEKEK